MHVSFHNMQTLGQFFEPLYLRQMSNLNDDQWCHKCMQSLSLFLALSVLQVIVETHKQSLQYVYYLLKERSSSYLILL